MNKTLLMTFSFLIIPQVVFSADNVDYNKPFNEIKEQLSDFDQRHSLMPVEIKPVQKTAPVVENDLVNQSLEHKTEESKSLEVIKIEKDKIETPEQKIVVKEEVKPVYVVPPVFPEEDKNALEKAREDLNQALFIPDVNDADEEEDYEKNPSALENKPVENLNQETVKDESKNEPFVLKEIPQKKYDGTDIIFSNIIEEKSGSMENHPLIINKEKNQEIQPVAENNPQMLVPNDMSVVEDKKQVEENPVKKVDISERNEIIKSIPSIKKTEVKEEEKNKDILTAHIASYTTEETANRGIDIWKEKYPLITILKTSVKYENVEGKGMFYRVYLTGDEAKIENLCNQMRANKDWCNILR